MSAWSFDFNAAPRDGRIWLATKCGKVSVTKWDDKRDQWAGLAAREAPVAWQPYIVPAHPGDPAAASRLDDLNHHFATALDTVGGE